MLHTMFISLELLTFLRGAYPLLFWDISADFHKKDSLSCKKILELAVCSQRTYFWTACPFHKRFYQVLSKFADLFKVIITCRVFVYRRSWFKRGSRWHFSQEIIVLGISSFKHGIIQWFTNIFILIVAFLKKLNNGIDT